MFFKNKHYFCNIIRQFSSIMISFTIALLALLAGYLLYSKFIERIFGPDDRPTPAVAHSDGVDFVTLPSWKVFMIQFLNIAGTGPIFGAIMGAWYGPVAYLWIILDVSLPEPSTTISVVCSACATMVLICLSLSVVIWVARHVP